MTSSIDSDPSRPVIVTYLFGGTVKARFPDERIAAGCGGPARVA
jgi:hypothetical protein